MPKLKNRRPTARSKKPKARKPVGGSRVKAHRRAVKDARGRVIGHVFVKPHVRTRPTKRFSIPRRKKRK